MLLGYILLCPLISQACCMKRTFHSVWMATKVYLNFSRNLLDDDLALPSVSNSLNVTFLLLILQTHHRRTANDVIGV